MAISRSDAFAMTATTNIFSRKLEHSIRRSEANEPLPVGVKTLSRRRTMQTIALLIVSNIFLTIAWYGYLKYKNSSW